MTKAESTLITTRRNFLVRATAFTAAGAAVAVPIIAAASGPDLIKYHLAALEKAFRDYYGADAKIAAEFSGETPESLFSKPHPTIKWAMQGGALAYALISATRSPIEERFRVYRDSGGPLLAADAGQWGQS